AKDSLILDGGQITALEKIHLQRKAVRDSILAPLVEWVESRNGKVDDQGLGQRLGKVQPDIQRELREATAEAAEILTPEQRSRLPSIFPQDRRPGQNRERGNRGRP